MKNLKNSMDILQDFVVDLLTESEATETESSSLEMAELNNKQRIQKTTSSKALKLAPTPLLSERLHRAKTLLKTMPEVEDVVENPLKETIFPEVFSTENLLDEINNIPEDEIITLQQNAVEELDCNVDEIESETISEIAIDEVNIEVPSPLTNGIPEWGKGSFQTLIFNIGELKLALPLIKLGGIHRLDPEPTTLPENPPWYLGLIADELGSIAVIDTALWIMPDKYDIAKSKGLDYEFFVLLDDTRWGLACSKVDNAIMLSEEDVRWNTKNSKRPWLAGMLVNEMCALLDVNTLISMLDGNLPATT